MLQNNFNLVSGEDKNVEEDFELQNFAKLLCDEVEGMKVCIVKLNHSFLKTLDQASSVSPELKCYVGTWLAER